MYTIHVYAKGAGLCNQLFALVNGISFAPGKAIAVGPFSADFKRNTRISADRLINLHETGNVLQLELHAAPLTSAGKFSFAWYTRWTNFVRLLQAIRFAPELEQIVGQLWNAGIDNSKLVNVVHFRIEPDAIAHWSKMNKMTAAQFTTVLHDQYRKAIRENIVPGSQILALTYDTGHPLIQELTKDYQILSLNSKKTEHRELSAAIDLMLGERCNGVFVGCHNFAKKRGSTFSFTLWHRAQHLTQGIFMDLDDIRQPLNVMQK